MCVLLFAGGIAHAGANANYKVAIHVIPDMLGYDCGSLPDVTGCEDITTDLSMTCGFVTFFPVFYGLTEVTGIEHGLTWPEEWSFLGYTPCADLTFGEIAAPGDGIQYSWTACQTGYSKVLGYGWLAASSPGQVEIAPHPSSGLIQVVDCSYNSDEPVDNVAAGLCGMPGEDPCATSFNSLNLSKADDSGGCAEPGSLLTYTLTYDNPNTDVVTNVVLADNIPLETSFYSATGGGLYFAPTNQVVWSIGTLGAGAGGSREVTVLVDPGATPGISMVDTCLIDSDETDSTETMLSTLVCYPPMTIVDIDDGVVDCIDAGDTLIYTIWMQNGNSATIHNVELFSHPPLEAEFVSADAGGTYDPSTNEVYWWLGNFGPGIGSSVHLTVRVNTGIPREITLVDTCWIDGDECGPSANEFESTLVCPFMPPDVTLTHDVDSCATPGRFMTYRMVYTNPNLDPISQASLVNLLPDSAVFYSASGGGVYDGPAHEVTWDIGTLAPGETDSVELAICPLPHLAPDVVLADTCVATCAGGDTLFASAETYLCSTAVWFVALTGDDGSGDGSQANPFRTVEFAVEERIGEGDTLVVMPGEYSVSWTDVDNSVAIVSESGPLATQLYHGHLEITGNVCTLDGFTITLDSGYSFINAKGDSIFTISNCVFTGCYGDGLMRSWTPVRLVNSTFYDNSTMYGILICNSGHPYQAENCIFAYNRGFPVAAGDCIASCCDVYGNEAGDYIWGLSGQEGVRGNFSADPVFCDTLGGDLHVRANSPCAPWDGNPCGLVGALGVGCGCETSITQVLDVGNDQGRQVRLAWCGSPCDAAGSPVLVTGYAVYRRQDAFLRSALAEAGEERRVPLTPLQASGWDYLMTVPALGDTSYQCVVPTLCDSTAGDGICWSVFKVIALTADPLFYFESDPDSGYSVDNLEPAMPTGLQMISPTEIAWNEAPEEDFNYFTAYGSESPEFDVSAVLIDYTIGTTMDVSEELYAYYHVTATDFSGNEGDAASVENLYSGLPAETLPTAYALMQNSPNPFDATTFIRFDLPEPGMVSVAVYDVSGRLIQSLTGRRWSAGRHSVVWDGADVAGRTVGEGIYFVRMEAGGFSAAKKMMILR